MRIRPRVKTISTALLGAASIATLAFSLTLNQTVSATVPGINQLASQSTSGTAANAASSLTSHSISGDGKYVVFTSAATNLTPEATAGVFVRDTVNQTTTMVSLSDTGAPVDGNDAKISYDGRYVIFVSSAASVVTGVTSGQHVYIRDLANNTTVIADTSPTGATSTGAKDPDINADGRYVVFITSDKALTGLPSGTTTSAASQQVVIKDMISGKTRMVSGSITKPSASSTSPKNYSPSIDCSGRVVSFVSNASNLGYNMYNWDYGVYTATIDWDVTYYKYTGSAFSYYNQTKVQTSCNGNFVTHSDTGSAYAMKRDRLKGSVTNVTLNSSGALSNSSNNGPTVASSISDDGRYIAFTNKGTNMDSTHSLTDRGPDYDLFVRDTVSGVTNLVSFTALGNYAGRLPGAPGSVSISPDGTTVAFTYATPDATDTSGELISGVHTGQTDVYTAKTGF